MTQNQIDFDGSDYSADLDRSRLLKQIEKVFNFMSDGRWRTLREISMSLNAPESSISAQLRNLRKDRFGGHIVERRRSGDVMRGLFEYRLNLTK